MPTHRRPATLARAALLALLVAMASAAPAGAQVAQDGDVVLVAPTATAPGLAVAPDDDDPAQLCVRALLPVEPGDAGTSAVELVSTGVVGGTQDCGDPLRSDGDALLLADAKRLRASTTATTGSGASALAGLVPADAARVVLRTRSGATRIVPTTPLPGVPGALAGRVAGRVAGIVVPVTADERRDVVEARVERPDGSLLGVATRLGSSRDELGGIVSAAPEVRSVATRAGELAVRRSFETTLQPTAAALERRVAGTCSSITLGGRPLGPLTRCAEDGPVPGSLTSSAAICRADRVVLSGLLAPGRTSGTALLADGRRVAVTVTARDALPGRRGWSLIAPRGVGVRRLVDVPDPAGSGAGLAPAALHCALDGSGEQQTSVADAPSDISRFVRERQAVVPGVPATLGASVGDQPLLAVDGPAGTICLGLGAAPRTGSCEVLGRDPASAPLYATRAAPDGGELVAGVTTLGAQEVRVRTSPRGSVRVATAPAGGTYAGAYAGALRTFSVHLPRGRLALDATVSRPTRPGDDGSDGILGYLVSPGAAALRVRRLAALPGGLHVDATVGTARTTPCAGVTSGPRPTFLDLDCLQPSDRRVTVVELRAPCAARRVVVTSVLEGSHALLRVVDDRGRIHRGRRIALRGRTAVHVVVLPRGRAPRTFATSGASGPDLRRHRLPVPPATQQCGWSDEAARTAPSTAVRPDIGQLR